MRIHFISIGGSVMHQLAIALKKKGHDVTGSDDDIFEPALTQLKQEGLLPAVLGWDSRRISAEIDAVILGMHARADNAELQRARELGVPVYSFPEYIYRESIQKTRVAVGGSHGKTTTTSMIMHVLRQAGVDFDYLVGARLAGFEQSVRITEAPVIVCEADEYPASALNPHPKFHFLHPQVAVLTGIAWDHINVFPTFENYLEQFRIFIGKIEPGGRLIYHAGDRVLRELVEANPRLDIHYQPYELPLYVIEGGETRATFGSQEARLQVFGKHNLLNLQAAYHVCRELQVDDVTFAQGAESFTGAAKRLEVVFENESVAVYRDFAHAPSKVAASIRAVKEQFPNRKLTAVLELHTYSSLSEEFLPQYAGAMDPANEAAVFYSNHALEIKRKKAPSTAKIREGFRRQLAVLQTREELEEWLPRTGFENHNLLFMSSGSFEGLDLHYWINQQIEK